MKKSRLQYVLFCLGIAAVPLFGAAASTHWLAARVGYHPRLGEPLTTTPFPLYEPWQWFGWAAAAAPTDLGLVLLTSLPLLLTIVAVVVLVLRHQRRRGPAKSSREALGVSASTSSGASRPDVEANRTFALTLSDADVEVLPPFKPKPKTVDAAGLEEVLPDSPSPLLESQETDSTSSVGKSRQHRPDPTMRADRASYGIIQQLAAHEHEEDETPPSSSQQPHIAPNDAPIAPDAPTTEASARSLDTAGTPISHTHDRPLRVDATRADWAHEVATAEAPAPGADISSQDADAPGPSEAARLNNRMTSVEDTADRSHETATDFPDDLDAELVEDIRRQLDAVDFDDTAPDEVSAAVASLDLRSTTQKLGAAESAALAQFATKLAGESLTDSPGHNDATSERPSSPSSAAEATCAPDNADTELDDEEWML